MRIAFIHNQNAFLPQVDAYRAFFKTKGIDTSVLTYPEWQNGEKQFDVEWVFMGFDRSVTSKSIRIHEYASSSVPPWMNLKNALKKHFNSKPHFRIFLNSYVKNCFSFNDSIPFGFMDMGLPEYQPMELNPSEKFYDFVYTGSVTDDREIKQLLDMYIERLDLIDKTILILSRNYDDLAETYRNYPNIIFKGPVPHHEVPGYLQNSKFAINFIPDKEPYNHQTSTKLLEYIHNRIPVITTDYAWMREFEMQYGGKYFYLNDSLSNFTWKAIHSFQYEFADLSELTWEKQILRSGVWEFLQKHL